MAVLNTSWPRGWSPDVLVEAGRRMTFDPATARAELEKLKANERRVIEEMYLTEANCETILPALAQLGGSAKCVAGPAARPAL